MNASLVPSNPRHRFIGPIVIALAMLFMLASTWGTWPDAIYDFGSQLYYPWQMSAGKHLYTDIAYFNGPVSQYFNAAMFTVFGVSLRTLIGVNLLIVVAVIAVIYHLINRLSGALAATAACLVFVLIFAFSQYVGIGNYNWICPYTHEVTHGVTLSLGMIASIGALMRTNHRRWCVASGVLLGLVFLTKAEVFVPAAGAAAVGFVLRGRTIGLRKILRESLWFSASIAVVVLIAFAIIAITINSAIATRAVLGSWPWIFDRRIAQLQFYRQGLGIDDLPGNLWKMLVIGAASSAMICTLLMLGLQPKRWRITVIVLLAIELISMLFFWQWARQIARPWPVFVAIIAGISVVRAWRQPTDRWIVRAVLSVFAFGLLGKMLVNARVSQYGFALAMPAATVLIEAIVGWIPDAFENRKQLRLAGVAVVAVAMICTFANQIHGPTTAVGQGGDQFFATGRGGEINAAIKTIDYLAPKTGGRNGTLAVMPQGLMLNYLTRRADSVAAVNLMPPEVLSIGEDRVVEELTAHPPDLIVLSEKDIRDGAFILTEGEYHYGKKIVDWVMRRYRCVTRADPNSELKLSYWIPTPIKSP